MDDLDLIIEELISRKVEGPYWDFKVNGTLTTTKEKEVYCMTSVHGK